MLTWTGFFFLVFLDPELKPNKLGGIRFPKRWWKFTCGVFTELCGNERVEWHRATPTRSINSWGTFVTGPHPLDGVSGPDHWTGFLDHTKTTIILQALLYKPLFHRVRDRTHPSSCLFSSPTGSSAASAPRSSVLSRRLCFCQWFQGASKQSRAPWKEIPRRSSALRLRPIRGTVYFFFLFFSTFFLPFFHSFSFGAF